MEENPAVWYRGTSSAFEAKIDREGLCPAISVYSRDEVHALASVFRSLNWWGGNSGAVSNLTAYTLPRIDAAGHTGTYFGEDPMRCLMYTIKSWAGGETAWSILECISYLRCYLKDDLVRREHFNDQKKELLECLQLGENPTPVIEVDLKWLTRKLTSLKLLEKRLRLAVAEHQYGVIYAVKFSRLDFPSLEGGYASGLRCLATIPPNRILAKLRLHGKPRNLPFATKRGKRRPIFMRACRF